MIFDYAEYYNGCFLGPIYVLSFILISIVLVLTHFVIYIVKHQTLPSLGLEKVVSIVIIVLIICFFVLMNGGRLANGGIFLFSEKADDAIIANGIIESVEMMTRYQFGELKSEYKTNEFNGVCIIINGNEYKAIAIGNLDVGDHVSVTYLPKSRYVLQIQKIL